jgi:hypothetical protein
MTGSSSLRTTWHQQRLWSAVAGRLKSEIARARTWLLTFIVTTAILETAAAHLTHLLGNDAVVPRALAMAGAVIAALAAVLQVQNRGRERLQQWTRARSTSEALKEHVYRYLTRTGTYAGDADAALSAERDRILGEIGDLLPRAAAETVSAGDLPAVQDIASYVKIRLQEQIDGYYLKQAAANARHGANWRRVQTALLYVSAALGGLVTFVPNTGLGTWVSVLTTVAGAFGAHIEAARYDHLAVSYRTTASRLQSLRDEWNDKLSGKTLTSEEQSHFVNRCEQAISVENEAWMAGWVKGA